MFSLVCISVNNIWFPFWIHLQLYKECNTNIEIDNAYHDIDKTHICLWIRLIHNTIVNKFDIYLFVYSHFTKSFVNHLFMLVFHAMFWVSSRKFLSAYFSRLQCKLVYLLFYNISMNTSFSQWTQLTNKQIGECNCFYFI